MLVINIPWELTVLINTRENLEKPVEKRETLHIAGGNLNQYIHYGKTVWKILRILKISIWSSNLTTGCVSKANKIGMLKRHLHSRVYCITIYNNQEMQAIYQVIHGFKNIYNRILFSHKKDWNSVNCDNGDGTGEHYVTWNKPGTER